MTPQQVIDKCENEMPKCYTDEFYPIALANNISDTHIVLLKERKAKEREMKKVLSNTTKIIIPSVLKDEGHDEGDCIGYRSTP